MTTTLVPHAGPATGETLRRIARLPDGPALSVILNLDPREFATAPARATALRSLEDDIRRLVNGSGELSTEAETVLAYLHDGEFDPTAGKAVAMFASEQGGYFEVVTLPSPTPTSVSALPYPALAPIAHLLDVETWCVALVDRAAARILVGTPAMLREWSEANDDVHRQHASGGWSQARWERSVEVEVDRHLDHVAEVVTKAWRRGFDRLALGVTPEMEPRMLEALGADERGRYVGRFDVDVQNSSIDQVADAAAVLFAQRDWERISETLDRAGSRSSEGLSAYGVQDVSTALEQRRVETLLLDPAIDEASFFMRQAALQDAAVLTGASDLLRDHRGAVAVLRF